MMSQGERIRGLGGREGGVGGEESEGKGENKKRRWKPAWRVGQYSNILKNVGMSGKGGGSGGGGGKSGAADGV